MSTAPNGWQNPKTNWASADVPLPTDFIRIESNLQAIELGQRTLDPTQAPSGNQGTLRQMLDWFANRIKAITGTTNWYDAPATTLAAAKSHMDATSGVHGATSSATANRLVIRDASGRAQFAVPSASGDAATKGYVDALLGIPMAAGTNFVVQVVDTGWPSSDTTYPNWQDSIRNRERWSNNVAVRILLPGTVRCALEHRTQSSAQRSYVRVLKNGSVVQEWNTNSESFVARSVDVNVGPGDVITFQQRISSSASGDSSYWRNVRVMTAAPTLGIQRIR